MLKRNSADRINFEDFSTHEFLTDNANKQAANIALTKLDDELGDNFKKELKINDQDSTTSDAWNNTASKLKYTLRNTMIADQQLQSKNCLINKTLKDSFQEQESKFIIR